MDTRTHVLGSVTSNVNGSPDLNKEDRSGFTRSSKLARTTTMTEDKNLSSPYAAAYSKSLGFPLVRSASDSLRQEHMLSFSDKPETQDFSRYVCLDNKNSLSPFLHQFPPQYRSSGGGYGFGGMLSMQGKGPFTLTQWAELEQQALIYKYITANVPIPSSLLISIQKSFYPYGSLPPSSFGWGTFHLGFGGGNMDPEPGRCRRTDGKKWRCSRDAVPDQKYCERHINRGRHRSRKLVEVQSNQTAAAAAAASKAVTTQQQSLAASGINPNRSLATAAQYINHPSTDSLPNNRVYQSTVNLQPKEPPKQRNNNSSFEFGHISSESLLNPNSTKSYGSSTYLDFSSSQDKHQGSSWPEELKSDWTQLSMSIPVASSSSSPSSTHITGGEDKTTLSPLRLSHEPEEETLRKVNTWIPISWGHSLGGPLGEVLNSTTNSPTLGSSPTGVLQTSTFCPLSNTSPVAESNNRISGGDYFSYTT